MWLCLFSFFPHFPFTFSQIQVNRVSKHSLLCLFDYDLLMIYTFGWVALDIDVSCNQLRMWDRKLNKRPSMFSAMFSRYMALIWPSSMNLSSVSFSTPFSLRVQTSASAPFLRLVSANIYAKGRTIIYVPHHYHQALSWYLIDKTDWMPTHCQVLSLHIWETQPWQASWKQSFPNSLQIRPTICARLWSSSLHPAGMYWPSWNLLEIIRSDESNFKKIVLLSIPNHI